MQITVTVTVDVPPGSDVDHVAERIAAAGQQAMQRAMAQAGRALEPARPACPRGGGEAVQPAGTVGRVRLTGFGKVRLSVRRRRCLAGRRRFRPAAAALAARAGGTLTARFRDACVPAGIRAARPGRGNREVRRQPYATIRGLLWDGAVEAAATEVADRPPAEVAPVAALEEALRYLATQRDWLGDDGAWRAAGEPVGSGVIARAVAVVSTWRMQRRGRRWRRRTAHAVVALRVRFRNADWDQRQRPLAAA